jgi:hypothetical protein
MGCVMQEITLTQSKVALVDDNDYPRLMMFKWYAKKSNKSWYVVRMQRTFNYSYRGRCKKKRQRRRAIRMHNDIMQPNNDEVVHHKDGNGLNNQRCNLVCVGFMENMQEAAKKAGCFYNDNKVPF